MIDINNPKYIADLRDAVASDQGQLIIEYLKNEQKQYDFENIMVEKRNNEEIGMDFKSFLEINKYFKSILSFFDELLKD
ncbi:MAG: hypothetical protein V1779_17725 [bacterium]